VACLLAPAGVLGPSDKLTDDERIELLRGLTAEFAKVKVPLAQSKKPLEISSDGTFNRRQWEDAFRTLGPAARAGDQIKITKITFQGDKLLLDINGGLTSGRHWYDNLQIGMGGQSSQQQQQQQQQTDRNDRNATPTLGTYIEVNFHKPMEGVTSAEVKKILGAVMDFDQHSAATLYSETLSPEMQKAIAEKRAMVGMTREEVKMALGPRDQVYRETVDGVETEDWIYGKPPGKITFVTFAGSKVIKVKDQYAGLGSDTVQH
jgi:hypothetical protein